MTPPPAPRHPIMRAALAAMALLGAGGVSPATRAAIRDSSQEHLNKYPDPPDLARVRELVREQRTREGRKPGKTRPRPHIRRRAGRSGLHAQHPIHRRHAWRRPTTRRRR
jgi:hypothetical protein